MRRRTLVCTGLMVAGMLSWLAPEPRAGQGPAPGVATGAYEVPRTPWGDPDLQGNYTNTYENGTPLERPAQFEGRRLEDVTGEELAELRREIERRQVAAFQGPIHGPDHWWQDNLHLERGSQAWFIIDPPDGRIPALTPQAQARSAERAAARRAGGRGPADSFTDRSLYDRCITRGMPGSMLPAIYGNSYDIVQGPGYVVIRYEMIHEARVVPLDNRPRLGPAIELDMGDARGRFEGDTLVVETTHFKERSAFRNADPTTLRVIERFTPISAEQLRWTVTIDDSSTWVRPWTFSMPLTRDTVPLPAYECHEGNYGLRNILSAARAEEARAAEGR